MMICVYVSTARIWLCYKVITQHFSSVYFMFNKKGADQNKRVVRKSRASCGIGLRVQTGCLSIWQDNLISNSYCLEADGRTFKLGTSIRKLTRCSHLVNGLYLYLICWSEISYPTKLPQFCEYNNNLDCSKRYGYIFY